MTPRPDDGGVGMRRGEEREKPSAPWASHSDYSPVAAPSLSSSPNECSSSSLPPLRSLLVGSILPPAPAPPSAHTTKKMDISSLLNPESLSVGDVPPQNPLVGSTSRDDDVKQAPRRLVLQRMSVDDGHQEIHQSTISGPLMGLQLSGQ
jgi:hypothetical protein